MELLNDELNQELSSMADVLDSKRSQREDEMAEIVLRRIADGIQSREADILALMASGSKNWQQAVREVVVRDILSAADGVLWCPEFVEKLRCDQRVMIYTGSHWEMVGTQQWKDFVGLCAERCGVPESQRMAPAFMKQLYEAAAFNVAKNRRQFIPDDEVWLNLANGTLVLRKDGSVTLREHRKEDLFTYTLNYAYDAQATCELWMSFINRVLPEMASREVLREFISYCFCKGHFLEVMLMLYGGGLNGKSVTLEIIENLLGSMNVSYLSLSDLSNDDVKRAAIEGKKLNISHESGKDVNPNVLKQVTSGERVTVRHLYRDPYETRDYGKLIAAFNELPRAENTFGFFRRLIILPYEVTIPKEEIDRNLASKLKRELPGILNWVLEALPGLLSRKEFTYSENCARAMEHYRLQSDNVRLFLNEACEDTEFTTKALDIYNAYRNYCFGSQLKPVSRKHFYDRLEGLGYTRTCYGNVAYFNLKITNYEYEQ